MSDTDLRDLHRETLENIKDAKFYLMLAVGISLVSFGILLATLIRL